MKSAWRNLLKHKTYMLINLFGLTLGLSVSIFILLFVRDEFSYDKFLVGYRADIPNPVFGNDRRWQRRMGNDGRIHHSYDDFSFS